MAFAEDLPAFARKRVFRLTAQQRDHFLVTAWLIITMRQFNHDELLLYPLALYFGWSFLRGMAKEFPFVTAGLLMFAFPAWNLLSVFWAVNPSAVVKYALQSFLTMMICYVAAFRLERRQVVLSIMIAGGIFAVASFLGDPTGTSKRGVFQSKNTLGLTMVLLWMAALCVALDGKQARLWRLVAVGLMPVTLIMLVRADSATAVLLAIGVLLIVVIGLITLDRGLMHPWVLSGFLALFAAFLLSVAFVLAVHDVDLVNYILTKFGKDATLTGRTVLWGYAFEEIRQRPLLGLGAGGFWTPQDWTSLARKIHVDFHIPFDGRFTFHNSYLNMAVDQGLIGAAIGTATFLWCCWLVLADSFRRPTMDQIFFVALAAVIFMRNMTEPGLMTPFSLMPMVLFMGALITLRERLARRRLVAPYPPHPFPPQSGAPHSGA